MNKKEDDESVFASYIKQQQIKSLSNNKIIPKKIKKAIKIKRDSSHNTYINEYYAELTDRNQRLKYFSTQLSITKREKLIQNKFFVEATIDLHNLTATQAQIKIINFIDEAVVKKLTCVQIIHGKGLASQEKYPVLKNIVNNVLQQLEQVEGFCSCIEKNGGIGAVVVLLKTSS